MSHRNALCSSRFRLLTVFALLLCTSTVGAQVPTETADGLFLFRPDTPLRQVRGAIIADKLNRPALARGYLEDLIATQPDAAVLNELRQDIGISEFLRMASVAELQPVAGELLQLMNEAARQDILSADQVTELVNTLGQSRQQTKQAVLRILSAEDTAIRPLLAADPTTDHGAIAAALLQQYVRRFRFGLVRELETSPPDVQVRILRLLSISADPRIAGEVQPYRFAASSEVAAAATTASVAVSPSTAAMTTPAQAQQLIVPEALELLKLAGTPFPTAAERQELPASFGTRPDADEAFGSLSLRRAAHLMRLATAISADDLSVNAAQLVVDMTANSWPPVWSAISLPQEPPGPANELDIAALEIALESGNAGAMLAMLGRPAAAAAVFAERSDLLRQYSFASDVRVRLLTAALARVANAANSRTESQIAALVEGSLRPDAVAIDSRRGESRTSVDVLVQTGYAAVGALAGQSGFEAATSQLQCELLLVHTNCLRWSLSDTITNLREDYRTRNVPIVIYGPPQDERRTATTRNRYRGIVFLPEPISELTFVPAARLAGVPAPALTEDERREMIQFARDLTRAGTP